MVLRISLNVSIRWNALVVCQLLRLAGLLEGILFVHQNFQEQLVCHNSLVGCIGAGYTEKASISGGLYDDGCVFVTSLDSRNEALRTDEVFGFFHPTHWLGKQWWRFIGSTLKVINNCKHLGAHLNISACITC